MIDNRLYTLLAVVEHESYTKAAQVLSLTQPAVSQHIKYLENELDIKIFNRVDKTIKPTVEGQKVIKYARRSIALYERLKQAIINEQKHMRKLVVGITHTAESNAVAEMFGKYSLKNPGSSISIVSDTINNLYDMVENFEIDLAVVEGKVNDPSINSLLLDTDSLVLVVSNKHALAKQNSVSINELKKEPLILRRPSSGTRNLFVAHLESNNISLDDFNLILEVDNIATIKDLIRRQVGVSILARSACLEEIKKGTLTALPIENLSMIREINIIYHHDFSHEDTLKQIISEYHKVLKYYE